MVIKLKTNTKNDWGLSNIDEAELIYLASYLNNSQLANN